MFWMCLSSRKRLMTDGVVYFLFETVHQKLRDLLGFTSKSLNSMIFPRPSVLEPVTLLLQSPKFWDYRHDSLQVEDLFSTIVSSWIISVWASNDEDWLITDLMPGLLSTVL